MCCTEVITLYYGQHLRMSCRNVLNAQTAHTTLPHTCINMTQHAIANIQNAQYFTLLIAQIHHNIQPRQKKNMWTAES